MMCPRCQGLMVRDLCCDLSETQGLWVTTTRCMNCGHVTDEIIEKHRQEANQTAGSAKILSDVPAKPEGILPGTGEPWAA
jgi:uncharacterized Zn finger protein